MNRVNYVIAVWGGDRRGGISDIIYVEKQIKQLQILKHNLTQITLCVSNGFENHKLASYLDSLKTSDLPIVIIHRENVGLSYGAYSEAYEKYRKQFDYYIFVEDDYYFVENNFDQTLVEFFNNVDNCGYVCGFVSRSQNQSWMGNSIGLTSSDVLETIRNKYGKIPFDATCQGSHYTEESGQVIFSNAFTSCGFKLIDITDTYEVLHYYWQRTKVSPIPGQQKKNIKRHLFLPFESQLSKTTSHFNQVFIPYENKHLGEEAIIFGTGPSLNAYDYLEDDGSRIKVGLNSMATKPVLLDYYFCGHIDDRSKPYLNQIKALNVRHQKFGYITLDGITGGDWLSLEMAKSLGVKPYGVTTEYTFHKDISKYCLVNHLIIFSALQFLIYTGVTRIYLVGSDATQLISCDDFKIDADRNVVRIIEIFKQFAEFARSKCEIISINPVGLKGIFQDTYRCDIKPFLPPEPEVPQKASHPTATAGYCSVQNQTILDAMNNSYKQRY